MQHSRRRFVGNALGGLAACAAGVPLGRLAHAASDATDGPERYYIFCYFEGAWDILLSLDPRDPRQFNQGVIARTLIEPAYDTFGANYNDIVASKTPGMSFGPYIGDLKKHSDKICLVRGLSMETLTHQAGRARFLTGRVPSGTQARGSSAATWLASVAGKEDTIPNLAIDVDSYNIDLPTFASGLRVGNVRDLTRALQRSADALPEDLEAQVAAFLAGQSACPSAQRSPLRASAEDSRLRAQTTVQANLQASFNFLANSVEMQAVRDRYRIPPTDTGLQAPGAQAALAVQALTTGVSRCVSVKLARGLDTHFLSWTTDQGPPQEAGFNALSALLDDLGERQFKGTSKSWLDHTVVVAFSEFSRTPLLNTRGGRDHSLTNACLLAGGTVAGGTIVGASSDVGMTPQGIDLNTGEVDIAGVVPRPEHIWQALFEEAGLGTKPDLRVPPLRAILG